MKVLCFGSLNIDYTYKVDHFVKKGETLSSGSLQVFSGGKGLNQSIALARAGAETYHAGSIGEDGRFLLEQLQDALLAEKEIIRIKQIPPRRFAWLRYDFSMDSYENPDFETSILQLAQGQKDSVVFLGKVGAGISREQLLAGKYDQYNMVFLILDSEDQYAGPAEILAAETCVTVRFCGSHKDAPAYYEKLAEYIKEQKLQITGFSKEITMIDFGLTNDPDQFVTEIQIPVCASSV